MVRERPCRSSPGSLTCLSPVDTGQDRLFIFLRTQQKTYRGTCCVFRYTYSPSTFAISPPLHSVKMNSAILTI